MKKIKEELKANFNVRELSIQKIKELYKSSTPKIANMYRCIYLMKLAKEFFSQVKERAIDVRPLSERFTDFGWLTDDSWGSWDVCMQLIYNGEQEFLEYKDWQKNNPNPEKKLCVCDKKEFDKYTPRFILNLYGKEKICANCKLIVEEKNE